MKRAAGKAATASKRQKHSSGTTSEVCEDGSNLLSQMARERIDMMAHLADCSISVGGTMFKQLHKVKLSEASTVLRHLFEDLDDGASVALCDDDPHAVALFISLTYEPRPESLQADNVDIALRMADKYDAQDLKAWCEQFLMDVKVTAYSLPHWLVLASQHNLPLALQRCLDFATEHSAFRTVMRMHSDQWLHQLPAALVTELLMPRLRHASATLEAMKEGLNKCYDRSAEPLLPATYPTQAGRHATDYTRSRVAMIDRPSLQVVMYNVARACNTKLQGDGNLDADAMRRLLPALCYQLPLPCQQP